MLKRSQFSKPRINLDGEQGNAFAVMGFVSTIMKSLGRDFKPVQEKMKSGDYLNLISVGYREVGAFTVWETDNEEYLEVLSKVDTKLPIK